MTTKRDCVDSIIAGAKGTSHWRIGKDRDYPGDRRNAEAAALLDQIAEDASGMTDDEWQQLQPHYGWKSQEWKWALSLATRQVGFSRHPRNFAAFVDNLVDALSQSVAA